ncbi:MAG TPA: efflux RND transporter periplasmic adaptor subunit [Armatimonadaceae bacterium]|nr:efflux RND transporter periplasmic adaptor subunit [Armatimonadaceae bacterium]
MKRWLFVLLSVVVLGSLIAWRLSQKRAEAAAEEKRTAARRSAPLIVETAPVQRRDVVLSFQAPGSVEAPLAVDVTPRVTGRITALTVREGDRVAAGQVLARLDPAEIEAEVRNREAALAQARARLAEAELAQNPNSVALSAEVRRQRAALGTARAQEARAKADFEAAVAAAEAQVTDAEGRIAAAEANITGADAAIASARANLANARLARERQETLFKEGAVAQQLVDNARTVENVQQEAVNQAQETRRAAVAARESALAQKQAAEKQAVVARNLARSNILASGSAVTQAQATLDAARANTGRDPAYAKNLDALRAVVRAAEAEVRASKTRLADTVLRAPIAGVVTQRFLDPGGLASPQQAVAAVQAIEDVWVTVGVPEEVSRRLYTGQAARVTVDGLPPGETLSGKVAQVLPAADPQSRQFTVRVRLANPKRRLRPGMSGTVAFETQRADDVLVVPKEALKRAPGGEAAQATVTVVGADGKASVRPVTTGLSDAKVVAIEGELAPGDQVVVVTGRDVKDGQTVQRGGQQQRGGAKPAAAAAAADGKGAAR